MIALKKCCYCYLVLSIFFMILFEEIVTKLYFINDQYYNIIGDFMTLDWILYKNQEPNSMQNVIMYNDTNGYRESGYYRNCVFYNRQDEMITEEITHWCSFTYPKTISFEYFKSLLDETNTVNFDLGIQYKFFIDNFNQFKEFFKNE